MIEEQERSADRDAQIKVLKQMLLSTPQRNEQTSSKEFQHHHQSFHRSDPHENVYRQLLERLMIDSSVDPRGGHSTESAAHRDG